MENLRTRESALFPASTLTITRLDPYRGRRVSVRVAFAEGALARMPGDNQIRVCDG